MGVRWGVMVTTNFSNPMKETNMKFPKTVYLTIDGNSDKDEEYLLAWESVPENDEDKVAEYRLVRKGEISTQEPSVNWGKAR